MTQLSTAEAGPRKLSITALVSFICGILVCVPFVTGALAILFGAIGILRTRNGARRGRWMAVCGLIAGLVAIVAWSGVGLVGGGVWAIWKGTEGPRLATHEFIRDLADHDMAAAKTHSTGISDQELENLSDAARQAGKFKDT